MQGQARRQTKHAFLLQGRRLMPVLTPSMLRASACCLPFTLNEHCLAAAHVPADAPPLTCVCFRPTCRVMGCKFLDNKGNGYTSDAVRSLCLLSTKQMQHVSCSSC